MKATELREMSIEELNELFEDSKKSLATLRMGHAISELENPLQLKFRRRDLARMKTELTRRNKEITN